MNTVLFVNATIGFSENLFLVVNKAHTHISLNRCKDLLFLLFQIIVL